MYLLTLILTSLVYYSSFGSSAPTVDEKHAVIVKGLSTFSLDLIEKLNHKASPNENIVVSPLSIYAALALFQMGASGKTREELNEVLGFGENDAKLPEYHKSLSQIYRKVLGNETKDVKISMGTGIFVQDGHKINSRFVEQIKRYNAMTIENVDFTKENNAMEHINKWISDRSVGCIPNILSLLNSGTSLLIATTLHFNAQWQHSFTKTITDKFISGAGELQVPFLSDTRVVPYYKNEALQFTAISLAYKNTQFRYYILLPDDSSDVHKLTEALTFDEFQKVIENSEKNYLLVDLSIPKLKFSYIKGMKEALQELDIKALFENAHLEKLLEGSIAVTDVKHGATFEADENGSEPLDGTTKSTPGIPPLPPSVTPAIKFNVNKPYMFVIHNIESETSLFYGVVHKPEV